MRRSKWKIINDFTDNLRSRIITPDLLNSEQNISTGNKIKSLKIKSNHVGFRLGDMVHSKSTAFYKQKQKKGG